MIVLDTNVLSEALRPKPDAHALDWLTAQPTGALFSTTITRAEILYGVRLLPKGKRRDALHKAIDEVFDTDFSGRILVFDNAAADAYAEIATARKRAGRPISPFDAMIAAIARSHGAALATRNTRDFVDCGVEVIDPWTAKVP